MKRTTVFALLLFSLAAVCMTAGCSGTEETPDSAEVIKQMQQENNDPNARKIPEELKNITFHVSGNYKGRKPS